MKPPKNVDDYIAEVPLKAQERLKEIRTVIKDIAPDAEEGIGFGMPYYHYKERLIYFKFVKGRIEVYLPQLNLGNNKKLKNGEADRVTLRFSLDKELPISLLKKLINARIKLIEVNKSD